MGDYRIIVRLKLMGNGGGRENVGKNGLWAEAILIVPFVLGSEMTSRDRLLLVVVLRRLTVSTRQRI